MITCPNCGYHAPEMPTTVGEMQKEDELDYWDVLLACGANVICPSCAYEFDPDSGTEHTECVECNSELLF